MRTNKDILRLKCESGKTEREIRNLLGLKSKTMVHQCIERAKAAGISWPLPIDMTEEMLEANLFPIQPTRPSDNKAPRDFAYTHEEVYNKKRLYSSIGYVPPVEFEELHKQANLF